MSPIALQVLFGLLVLPCTVVVGLIVNFVLNSFVNPVRARKFTVGYLALSNVGAALILLLSSAFLSGLVLALGMAGVLILRSILLRREAANG